MEVSQSPEELRKASWVLNNVDSLMSEAPHRLVASDWLMA